MNLHELFEDFLHRNFVDDSVGIYPFEMLVDLNEGPSPVGGELKLIFGVLDILVSNVLQAPLLSCPRRGIHGIRI